MTSSADFAAGVSDINRTLGCRPRGGSLRLTARDTTAAGPIQLSSRVPPCPRPRPSTGRFQCSGGGSAGSCARPPGQGVSATAAPRCASNRPRRGACRRGGGARRGAGRAACSVTSARRAARSERSPARRLERSFARRMNTDHALAVNSGTSALMCGLVGMGVGPGDEVVVPAYTWFSGDMPAIGCDAGRGRRRRLAHPRPNGCRVGLSSRTRAIVAVHMRGAPMNSWTALQRPREGQAAVATRGRGSGRGRLPRPATREHRRCGGVQLVEDDHGRRGGMLVSSDARVPAGRRYHDSAARSTWASRPRNGSRA